MSEETEVVSVPQLSAKVIKVLKAEGDATFNATVAIGQWAATGDASQEQTLQMLREAGIHKSKPWLSKRTVVYNKLVLEWQMTKEELNHYEFEFWYEAARHLGAVKKQKDPRELLELVEKNDWTVKEFAAYLQSKEQPKTKHKEGSEGGIEVEYEKVSMSTTTITMIDAVAEMVESQVGLRVAGRDKVIELALEHALHDMKEGVWVPDVEQFELADAGEE